MEIGKFTVQRNSAHKQPRVVTVEGEEMTADVAMQEIELVSCDNHGTLTLRFYKTADRHAINLETSQGGTVTLSLVKTDEDEMPVETPAAA
jgi:hypothetical protein